MKYNIRWAVALAFILGSMPATHASVVISPFAGTAPQTTLVTANTTLPNEQRIFTLSKTGVITVTDRNTKIGSVFNDLSSELVTNGERGLLGMAFDPDYATNGHYYVFMNTQPGGAVAVYSEVRRYTDNSLAGVAAEGPQTVMRFDTQGYTNHIGGWIGFDNTGNLLVGVGDGGDGSGPDIRATGQDPSDFFGSILRINPNGDDFPSDPFSNYAIPSGNLASPALQEVYAYGIRNPFRNSVAPDGSLIVADVGQVSQEEITIIAPDALYRNLGWSLREGDVETPGVGGPIPADYLAPDFVYDHPLGGAAVIGGFVYRGSAVPELFDRYVFGDQVSGDIWSILYSGSDLNDSSLEYIGNIPSLVSFGETFEGELFATQFGFTDSTSMIFSFSSDAVPEPESWVMMILGIGVVGMALRRRGSALAV